MPQDATRTAETGWRSGRVALRCTGPWAGWLGRLSAWNRLTTSQVVEQALYRFAEASGFNERPPLRIPRKGQGGARG